jgi:hypothetical protein
MLVAMAEIGIRSDSKSWGVRNGNIIHYTISYKMFRCKYTQYTYIVGKYQINLYQLYKQVEKRVCGELFCPVSRRVQMNFIFRDNLSYPMSVKMVWRILDSLHVNELASDCCLTPTQQFFTMSWREQVN